jgi:hypothetical protein
MLSTNVEVYDFGISLASLSQYLQMARYIRSHFDPDILVINVVHNDFDESLCSVRRQIGMLCLVVEGETVREASIDPYSPNSVFRMLRHSALVRYLVLNLHVPAIFQHALWSIWLSGTYNANVDPIEVRNRENHIRYASNYVLKRLQMENKGRPIIFLIDAPRQDIYSDTIANSKLLWLHELLLTQCREFGFDLIDLTDEFSRLFHLNHVRFETEYDGHWNEYGHKIVASQLYNRAIPLLNR